MQYPDSLAQPQRNAMIVATPVRQGALSLPVSLERKRLELKDVLYIALKRFVKVSKPYLLNFFEAVCIFLLFFLKAG